jgi:hypothetical protein
MHACLAQQHQILASLPLEGVETNMLSLLESGVCIQYAAYRIQDTGDIAQYAGYIYV